MQGAVEAPQLYRVVAMEETVEIEEVVAAVMVMGVAVAPVTLVPDTLDLREGLGLDAVHPLHQIGVHLLAVAHPLRCDLQGFVEQIVVAGDDVDKVADAPRCVAGAVKVDVDAAGLVGKPARLA